MLTSQLFDWLDIKVQKDWNIFNNYNPLFSDELYTRFGYIAINTSTHLDTKKMAAVNIGRQTTLSQAIDRINTVK